MKVLVVEDHEALRGLLVDHLVQAGFAVDAAASGREALAWLELGSYDAMLLDLGLPDMDGMALLDKRRGTANADLPCIVLTARDALHSRVAGLNAGADDYILKPFDMQELEARLRAVLRRPGSRVDTVMRCGNLVLQPQTRHMSVDGNAEVVLLARREAMLLEEMLRIVPGIVIKERLEERLYAFNEPVTPNAIEALVSRLRRKLACAGADSRIDTVRGLGYRLQQVDTANG
ncbi:response regulator transcription factor [Pseudomonas sp. JQ170]|uniref:response regulator transcription factor n=1 Tax=unclassified Pseudomonas TaxID=196821 RepID=UPI002655E572|nr:MULTISPECIES: response regulator transcription factor [unclassified Pseudomonas]MDN7139286.1 response regulator transcription factor [Pseudomonas sp. JQ170]WRO77393.1 response regulator transcription factor [Pseudomonas sp. 170C]